MQLWCGCSGWQYPEWEKKFYPKKLPASHWFEFYAAHFNSVEINYSHYHNITEKNLKKWYEQAPKNFKYSLKVHRLITHYKKMTNTKNLLDIFYKKTDLLQEKLGCILFQFPSNFTYHQQHLENIIKQLNPTKKNVLEFRHKSWWREDVLQTLQANHIIFCSVDSPDLPRLLMPSQKICYLRFHGRSAWYFGNYSKRTLHNWLMESKKQKIQEIWAYFNNTALAYAPKNALELQQLFNELDLKYTPRQ